jgi:hypothetical protein
VFFFFFKVALEGVLAKGMEVHVELKLRDVERGSKIGKGATGDVLAGKLKIESEKGSKLVNVAVKLFE